MSKYTYAINTNLKYQAESRLAQHIITNHGFHALDEMIMYMLDRAMTEHNMYYDGVDVQDMPEKHIAQVAKSMLKEYK